LIWRLAPAQRVTQYGCILQVHVFAMISGILRIT
jgi:hypothetical protein